MSSDVRSVSDPFAFLKERTLIRWICTSNPFYVLSAVLFLAGLRISFGAQARDIDTWALMAGLAGYTLLLAGAAWLLVRFGNVWDDVRTVLLLVVLMFLATSVTFDELLAVAPLRGFICYVVGLLWAIGVSEAVLRGLRLRLPAWFRGPYYLILSLFFLYPLALQPFLAEPHGEALMWGLFGFSTAAALAFLTLVPAIRRGPEYVRDNGSPWPWPFYPWSLFVYLGIAVIGRAFLLCWSMHHLDVDDIGQLVFGPYFLVPFGLAIAVLLLEIGIVGRYRGAQAFALGLAASLVVLPLADRHGDRIYEEFLGVFSARLGGTPLYVTLLGLAGFYFYAAVRRVPMATEALTAVLASLAIIGPSVRGLSQLGPPQITPLLAAAALQLGLGLWQRSSWRCLLAAAGLALAANLALPVYIGAGLRGPIALHILLAAMMIVGAAFDDAFARLLRVLGGLGLLLACQAVLFGKVDRLADLPWWVAEFYPPVVATILAVYGFALGHVLSLILAAGVLGSWLTVLGVRGYRALRQFVVGLDYLAWSFALFAVAMLVSLAKSGILKRRDANPQTDASPPGG